MTYPLLPNNATYLDSTQLPDFLWLVEGNKSIWYQDAKNLPTIGVGLNLTQLDSLAVVLNQMTYNGQTVFAAGAAKGQSALQVLNAFELFVNYPGELNGLLISYLGGVPSTNFEDFGLLASANALNEAIAGTVIGNYTVTGSSPALSTLLSGQGITNIPQNSGAWEALNSLYFNAKSLIGSNLISALKNNDAGQAWYQIRYASNSAQSPGVAQRRYYESTLIGLYQPGDTTTQAIQDYEMLTEHRFEMLDYETEYGTNPNTAGNPTQAQNLIRNANVQVSVFNSISYQNHNNNPSLAAPAT